ncbi:hypothetical protein SHIRM173S_11271 [Streptomyces hirsutus]
MTRVAHLEELYGLRVFHSPGASDTAADLPRPETVAWRIATETYDAEETWEEAFARFCAMVDTTKVRALAGGPWEDASASAASRSAGAAGPGVPTASPTAPGARTGTGSARAGPT